MNTRIKLLLSIICFTLIGCAPTVPNFVDNPQQDKKNLYASGVSSGKPSLKMARAEAETNARANIQRTIRSTIESKFKDFQKSDGISSKEADEGVSFYEESLVEATESGVRIVKYDSNRYPKYKECYALVVLDRKSLDAAIENATKDIELENRTLWEKLDLKNKVNDIKEAFNDEPKKEPEKKGFFRKLFRR